MRGLFSTGEGRVRYQPPLDETEDAKKFCPHCYGRLDKTTTAPTILPPPWFDHERREVIVGDQQWWIGRMCRSTVFRLRKARSTRARPL
jgi:hypothetical protein